MVLIGYGTDSGKDYWLLKNRYNNTCHGIYHVISIPRLAGDQTGVSVAT